jgi:hypothetical protein
MTSVLASLENITALMEELETLLGDYLGTFSDGQIALWAEPPFIPPTLKCSGLQVVVGRWEENLQPQKACVGSAQAVQRNFWRVTLICYPQRIGGDLTPEDLEDMDSAIAAMERRFPLHRKRSPQTKEDAYPQVSFLLDKSSIINLSL